MYLLRARGWSWRGLIDNPRGDCNKAVGMRSAGQGNTIPVHLSLDLVKRAIPQQDVPVPGGGLREACLSQLLLGSDCGQGAAQRERTRLYTTSHPLLACILECTPTSPGRARLRKSWTIEKFPLQSRLLPARREGCGGALHSPWSREPALKSVN